jgi:DNA invertase Pin-like site-specific DNA recombinase
MSTEEQLKGDSRRRQLSRTREYAQRNNLDLQETVADLGVSAFRGLNVEHGALSRFLALVRDGKIDPGSVLIVESMDRLTRASAQVALGLLIEIIQSGIVLATLDDGQTYSKESVASMPYGLMVALGAMVRSHEESKRKSDLLSHTWDHKKREARSGAVLTRKLPGWLEVDSDGVIVAKQERAEMVREIFTLARDGWGAYSIARLLNERRADTWSKSGKVWRESYVKKILSNRSVLGEYQPHRVSYLGGKRHRIADGEPISNYFPKVVDELLYREAHDAIARRASGQTNHSRGGGRKGVGLANLFTGLLACGLCRNGYVLINKGNDRSDGRYLVCSIARISDRCSAKPYRYHSVESALLAIIENLDYARVMGAEARDLRLRELRNRLAVALASRNAAVEASNKLIDIILSSGSELPEVRSELLKQQALSTNWSNEVEAVERELAETQDLNPEKRKQALKLLLGKLRSEIDGEERETLRRAMAAELRRAVKRVAVLPSIRLVHEVVSAVSNWKEVYGVEDEASLQSAFDDFPFEFSITYQNGQTHQLVDPLTGVGLKLSGSPRDSELRLLLAR